MAYFAPYALAKDAYSASGDEVVFTWQLEPVGRCHSSVLPVSC